MRSKWPNYGQLDSCERYISIISSRNTVIFHYSDNQIAVRKSPFASTETAKSLKINTINYAREILNQRTFLHPLIRNAIMESICVNRKILRINDLKQEPDFPHQAILANEITVKTIENEVIMLMQEQARYLQRVQEILSKNKYSDRDALTVALGLNHRYIFNGRDDIIQRVLNNKALLKLIMVSCGKVLLAGQDNNNVIDFLLQNGVPIDSADEKGMTALHYAVQSFYNYRKEPIDLIKKLLDSSANLEAKDKQGRTPLMLAKEHSQKTTVNDGRAVELLEHPGEIVFERRSSKTGKISIFAERQNRTDSAQEFAQNLGAKVENNPIEDAVVEMESTSTLGM